MIVSRCQPVAISAALRRCSGEGNFSVSSSGRFSQPLWMKANSCRWLIQLRSLTSSSQYRRPITYSLAAAWGLAGIIASPFQVNAIMPPPRSGARAARPSAPAP